jgi:hypothetical protein
MSIMNMKRHSAWVTIALLCCGSTVAQTVPPPEPGAAATPGQENPQRRDPSTTTPSTVDRPPNGSKAQENTGPTADPDMSVAAERRPKVGAEAKLGGIAAGSIVQSPAGEPIGRVKDIVPDAHTGEPTYVLIASGSGNTAVPYAVVAPMFQNGHIVLDRSRLESAPRVSDRQLQNTSDATWKTKADRYWQAQNKFRLR